MTGAAGFLAGWRAWRAAQAAEPVPGVPGAAKPPGTPPNPQKTAIVPGVPVVPGGNDKGCERSGAAPASAPEAAPWDRWRALPFGPERGEAFMAARMAPGACQCCAGRRWWRPEGAADGLCCLACHPPPPGLAWREVMP